VRDAVAPAGRPGPGHPGKGPACRCLPSAACFPRAAPGDGRCSRCLEELEGRQAPATFTVTNTADSGASSLRQAILNANANPGLDLINFAIPGAGTHTIAPLTPLPFVTDPVILDGTTQPGYAGSPLIDLFGGGGGTPVPYGLVVTAGGTLVQGLAVGGFSIDGVLLAQNGGDVIAADYVGTDPTGKAAVPNGFGVVVAGGGADQAGGNVLSGNTYYGLTLNNTSGDVAANNTVGANAAGTADVGDTNGLFFDSGANGNSVVDNVLSGCEFGVDLTGGAGNVLQGNFIGTNAAGTAALENSDGVNITSPAGGNTVGGTTAAARNVISGNLGDGVTVFGAGGNVIEGNFIGTQANGTSPLANGQQGVDLTEGAANNTVGGAAAGAGNVIAFNGSDGVLVGTNVPNTPPADPSQAGAGNAVLGNSIFGNGLIGIDLGDKDGVTANDSLGHAGPNDYQNFPALSLAVASGNSVLVTGTLSSTANTGFRIELFADPKADPSGHGQGQTFLGFVTAATDGNGHATFAAVLADPLAAGQAVSATATDSAGDTSEFSADVTAH
jgi:parallel beta-helix repeat protein